jgi:preprotein translocase subunit SecD
VAARGDCGAVAATWLRRTSAGTLQHFAIVLDNQLLAVSPVAFSAHSDGLARGNGVEVLTGVTAASAKSVADEVRWGPLPLELELASES